MAASLIFSIIDHGCDGEQYFPGCGVAFTKYTECVTGIGNSAKEAAEDALEQFYLNVDRNELAVCDVESLERACASQDATNDASEADNPEWHHYVSIRWRFWQP